LLGITSKNHLKLLNSLPYKLRSQIFENSFLSLLLSNFLNIIFLSMVSAWLENSFYRPYKYDSIKIAMIWSSFCCSLLILFHSFWIHGTNRHLSRNFTEILAIFTMISCIFLHIAGEDQSLINFTTYSGLLTYGILRSLVQVLDNYMVLIIYRRIVGIHPVIFALISLYLWIIFLTYLPFVTFLPFFLNINSPIVLNWFKAFGYFLWSSMYLVFNFIFGWKIWIIVHTRIHITENKNIDNQNTGSLTYRNIFHLTIV